MYKMRIVINNNVMIFKPNFYIRACKIKRFETQEQPEKVLNILSLFHFKCRKHYVCDLIFKILLRRQMDNFC